MLRMIGRLRGELVEVEGPLVVIDVGGVGYEVSLPDMVLLQLPNVGEEVTLLIRQHSSGGRGLLYGFTQPFQRRLFDLLLSVKRMRPEGRALADRTGGGGSGGYRDPRGRTRGPLPGPPVSWRAASPSG